MIDSNQVLLSEVEYSESRVLKDTKNILHQIFIKRYCKLMQLCLSFEKNKKRTLEDQIMEKKLFFAAPQL